MATYQTILTTYGATAIAAAIASGIAVPLAQMAVGDGAGNPTIPNAAQVSLVREVYRANVSAVAVDPLNPSHVIVEFTIPAASGGWTISEVGAFDVGGNLIAVANFPQTYKTTPADGMVRDLTIRLVLAVSSSAALTIGIDPSAVYATQAWVNAHYTIAAQIPGGTTGQVPRKHSNASGDIEWWDPTAGVVVLIDVRKEVQTLASGQTIINLATLTTAGLSLYVEGIRDEGFTANSTTQLTLDRSYPAGTTIYLYQNDSLSPSNLARLDLGNLFNGIDPGAVAAGQVSTGGGIIRTYGAVYVGGALNIAGSSVMAAVTFAGADPGSVAAGQVVVSGGILRAAGTVYANAFSAIGTIYANAFSGDGSAVTALNGSNIATGTVPIARLSAFGTAVAGVVPASGGGSINYLRADGSWSTPIAGASLSVANTWTAAQTIGGTDPGSVSAGQVTVGGGVIRAAVGIYAPQVGTDRRAVSAAQTLSYSDSYVDINAGGPYWLPLANSFGGKVFEIMIWNQSGAVVTIYRSGSDVIGNGTTSGVIGNVSAARFTSDGVSRWQRW